MKVLGILAGPRKGHATDVMVDMVLKGFKQEGAEVDKLSLYDMDIKPCLGCYKCAKTGKCFIEDDHPKVLDRFISADVVVFGSPTYWSNITSEAKKFFDRSLRLFEETQMGPRRTALKPSKVILITACGVPYPLSHILGVATGAMKAMKIFFGYMRRTKIYCLYATGMVSPEESRPSKRQLTMAYRLGTRLVHRN